MRPLSETIVSERESYFLLGLNTSLSPKATQESMGIVSADGKQTNNNRGVSKAIAHCQINYPGTGLFESSRVRLLVIKLSPHCHSVCVE